METQRILMSLAVVVFASVIWTITVDAVEKVVPCCTAISRLTRAQFTDPIVGFRLQNESLPCVKAIVFKTVKRGEFCLDWRPRWVQEEVKLL
ncbi:hypothetical protein PO909_017257 [Leuciscus waleckii]